MALCLNFVIKGITSARHWTLSDQKTSVLKVKSTLMIILDFTKLMLQNTEFIYSLYCQDHVSILSFIYDSNITLLLGLTRGKQTYFG